MKKNIKAHSPKLIKGKVQLTNNQLKQLASRHEKYSQNNNVFNNKNLSDNTTVSSFYEIKAKPELAHQHSSIQSQKQKQQNKLLRNDNQFSNNALYHVYDDNTSIKACKLPSNLVEVPRINEKYEISSFFGQSAQYKENMRTMGLISNMDKDPILNMNPSFYGGIQKKDTLSNPFDLIQSKKQEWNPSQKYSYVKDLVNHSDIDHPLSFHNQASVNQQLEFKINFPSNLEQNRSDVQIKSNGFYSREPITLYNAYQPYQNPYLLSIDKRIFDDKENQNGNVFQEENLLYKVNQDLHDQMQNRLKLLEQEKLRVDNQSKKDQQQFQNEEISPGKNIQRVNTINQINGNQFSESQNYAPTIEQQYTDDKDKPRNIFSIQMSQPNEDDELSQNSPDHYHVLKPKGEQFYKEQEGSKYVYKDQRMDQECRKDLPPSKELQTSPEKSVRFSEKLNNNLESKSSPYQKSQSQISSGQKQSSHQQQEDSEEEDDYGESGSSEEDDEVLDQGLQDKIENIKRNLKDSKKSGNQKEDSINKLENVLKRQRDRLENLSSTNKSGQFQNTQSNKELINFELSKQSQMKPSNTMGGNPQNLERAYEELEKEIIDIKQRLQRSLGTSQGESQRLDSYSRTQQQRDSSSNRDNTRHMNPTDRNLSVRQGVKGNSTMKSPGLGGETDEHDYSLSVSDLNSLYNTSGGRGMMGASEHMEGSAPRFKY